MMRTTNVLHITYTTTHCTKHTSTKTLLRVDTTTTTVVLRAMILLSVATSDRYMVVHGQYPVAVCTELCTIVQAFVINQCACYTDLSTTTTVL